MEKEINNERKSNIELLRILSIVLILLHHFYYNNFNFNYSNITVNQFIVQFLSWGGKVGVNCFILITGYFMIDSKFKIKKLFKVLGQIYFYSIGILVIFMIFTNYNIGIKNILKCIFPITYNTYWFMTACVIIYILSGWINKFLHALTKNQYIGLILLLFLIWTILPTFIFGKIGFSNIDWLIFMYMIGAYIKLFPNKYFDKTYNILLF